MALNFPASPADGDEFQNWVYSSAKGAWLSKPLQPEVATTSDTAPAFPQDGYMWYNTNDGTTYVYYVDPNGGQWVEMVAPVTANGYLSPNYVINGGFDIWQRGTSFSTSGSYTADRWYNWTTSGTVSVSRQTFTSGELPAPGFGENQFFMRHSWTAGNGFSIAEQKVEDVRTFSGQTVTLSFWARSNVAITTTPEIEQNFGSGGSSSVYLNTTSVNIGTSWARYSVTYTMPSISGKTIGANSVVAVRPIRVSGTTSHQIDIWGVQFEASSVATPFRRSGNTIQEELANCQRYYVQFDVDSSTGYGAVANGMFTAAANAATFYIPLPVPMRINPASVTFASPSGIGVADTNSTPITNTTLLLDSNYKSNKAAAVVTSGGGTGTAYRPAILNIIGAGKYIGFSAEL